MTNTNTSDRTRKLIIISLLAAITFFLGLTPYGYIPLTPTFKITILCIPVIIGVITEGLVAGLVLGAIFGLTSLFQIFMGLSPLGTLLYGISPIRTLIIVFIPRLLVPVTAYLTYNALIKSKKNTVKKSTYAITALVGSLTNTILFLGSLYVLYIPEIEVLAEAFGTTADKLIVAIGAIVLTNGVPEAIAAAIIVSLVGLALYYAFGQRKSVPVQASDEDNME